MMITKMKLLTVVGNEQRNDVQEVEKIMLKWCDAAKGKDKTMCYYMGVGDAESGTAGGVKRDVSSSLTRGINAKRLCTRLKKKDGQMCELRYTTRNSTPRRQIGKSFASRSCVASVTTKGSTP